MMKERRGKIEDGMGKIEKAGYCAFLFSFVGMLSFLFIQPTYAGWSALHGFAEEAFGLRVSDDKLTKHKSYNMAEQRLQLKSQYSFDGEGLLSRWQGVLRFKGDATVDEYFGGKTDFELREANFSFTPASFMDVKLGRQVLTWGTGDYLFINGVFPKDYESFFIGRDDEYLKKPSDALKVSFYPKPFNIDFVVLPYFTPNTLPVGDRLSFFDSFQGGIAGRASDRHLVSPSFQPENFEYAGRLYRSFGALEAALYVSRGYDKMPRSYKDEANRQLYYERQDVFGASVRAPFLGGIGNLEAGYLRSPEDAKGGNRLIENSSVKAMAGYEKDLGHDLKVGFQYLYEQKLDYDAYRAALLPADFFWDEHRHLVTQRITKLFKNQTVMVSFFNFYSPSDQDGYVRVSVSYDVTDQWKVTTGVNMPWGEGEQTEFAQMKKNKNIFVRVKYSF